MNSEQHSIEVMQEVANKWNFDLGITIVVIGCIIGSLWFAYSVKLLLKERNKLKK